MYFLVIFRNFILLCLFQFLSYRHNCLLGEETEHTQTHNSTPTHMTLSLLLLVVCLLLVIECSKALEHMRERG